MEKGSGLLIITKMSVKSMIINFWLSWRWLELHEKERSQELKRGRASVKDSVTAFAYCKVGVLFNFST